MRPLRNLQFEKSLALLIEMIQSLSIQPLNLTKTTSLMVSGNILFSRFHSQTIALLNHLRRNTVPNHLTASTN